MSEANSQAEAWDDITDEQLAAVSASDNYRRAEAILFDYPCYPQMIANLQSELCNLMPGQSRSVVSIGGIPGSSPHDTSEPERWATIRVEGRRARELRDELIGLLKCQAAVDAARSRMSPLELRYVDLRYIESHPPYKVRRMLNLQDATYYRLRMRVVGRVISYGQKMCIFPA